MRMWFKRVSWQVHVPSLVIELWIFDLFLCVGTIELLHVLVIDVGTVELLCVGDDEAQPWTFFVEICL